MTTLIDTLLVSLKLDGGDFKRDAGDATKANKDLADSTKKATSESDKFAKSINNGVKALAGLFSAILVSTGMQKLIDDTAKANDQLNFLSKNLGMNAANVKRWQGAAEMSGGSADGMAASLSGLNKSLWDMVTMGDTSVLPYFNALNVGVIKSNGELRNLDDILLDVSDSLSKMSRPQAYNFAKNMGFDDGTINMLLQGRREVEEYLALQKDIVVSSEQELEISRQLNKQNALVNRQWEGLKTLLANYLMPYALKFSETISGFLNYLNRNRDTAVFVFKAIGTVIGLTLIPLALKAGVAFMGMFAPLFGGVGLIFLLAGAIAALYDDYDKWKKGEKSLFDWKEWDASITFVLEKLKAFKEWFKDTTIGKWFTDQDGNLSNWKLALGAFALWFGGSWVAKILGGFASLSLGATRWALSLTGAFAAITAGAAKFLAKNPWLLMLYSEQTATTEQEDNATRGANRSNFYRNHAMDNLNKSGKSYTEVDVINESLRMRLAGEMPEPTEDDLNAGTSSDLTNRLLKNGAIGAPEQASGSNHIIGNSRGERNNNPLNINYAKQRGAVLENGKGARFAKFNTPYEGLERTAWQLRRYYDGLTTGEKLQTVQDIVKTWSPKGDGKNDPAGYAKRVAEKLGVSPTDKIDIKNDDVMFTLMDAMSKEEINKPLPYPKSLVMAAIKGTGDPVRNMAENIQSFQKQISTPFAAGINGLSNDFLGQSSRLQSQAQTINNNRTDVNVANINVNTNASTLSGVSEVVAEESIKRVYQMVPTMS